MGGPKRPPGRDGFNYGQNMQKFFWGGTILAAWLRCTTLPEHPGGSGIWLNASLQKRKIWKWVQVFFTFKKVLVTKSPHKCKAVTLIISPLIDRDGRTDSWSRRKNPRCPYRFWTRVFWRFKCLTTKLWSTYWSNNEVITRASAGTRNEYLETS